MFMALKICDMVILCRFCFCEEDNHYDYTRGMGHDQAHA